MHIPEEIPLTLIPTRYATMSAFTFLVYDYLLTYKNELNLIWNRGWSLGKVLFILNRYFGIGAVLFDVYVFSNKEVSVVLRQIWLVETNSIYAVYDRKRKIFITLIVLLIIEILGMVFLTSFGIPKEYLGVHLGGCAYVRPPPDTFLSGLPAIILESIMFGMMAYRARMAWKNDLESALLRLIIRDSVLYFLSMILVLLMGCLCWASAFGPHVEVELALNWTTALSCALGSRLLLNMRSHFYRNQSASQMSTLQIPSSIGVM
ncbi:hypothetical protein K439DRAFT_1159773 [Ramaria rubella]|nr:hypothetical protein K439DRAFT_1159773 [Ramaria rubella]